jgi:kynurenine formamidase
VPADPPGNHPTTHYIDHQQGLPRMLQFFDGLKAQDLPDGQGWAVEQVSLSTHNGTHLDAPWHFHPTMNRGERSWTIAEVPLELCLQPGVKLDFRHLPDGYVATADRHKAGRHIGYCHLEKLHNLEQLPSTGFTVSCFPVKIDRASAGWARAVAIIDG